MTASVLLTTMGMNAIADQPATTATTATTKNEKTYTGTVTSVDPQEHVLSVKSWAFSKKAFNLAENCAYSALDKNPATAADFHAGQKVTVTYQDAHGVLIADRVEQTPMFYEGMVKEIHPDQHELVLGSGRHLRIADDCKVVLRDGKTGSLASIQVGNHVTVTYETPESGLVARQIAQTSIDFTGTLTAVDLEARTVKAKSMFATKKFNLADHCAIVINNRPDGKLADLRLNDEFVFSYDEINGINVVNRIAPTGQAHNESVVAAH